MTKPNCDRCRDTGWYRAYDYDREQHRSAYCDNLPTCKAARFGIVLEPDETDKACRYCGKTESSLSLDLYEALIGVQHGYKPNRCQSGPRTGKHHVFVPVVGGYIASHPDMPGCHGQGDTEAEAVEDMRCAMERWKWTKGWQDMNKEADDGEGK